MNSITDLPRVTFKQNKSGSVNEATWLFLRIVTFLDCAVAIATTIELVAAIMGDPSPPIDVFVCDSIFLACCCFHSFRLRFWQYSSEVLWWKWATMDAVVLASGAWAAFAFDRRGFWYISTLNLAAWLVHHFYFRVAALIIPRGDRDPGSPEEDAATRKHMLI